jgi:hypothetical protein
VRTAALIVLCGCLIFFNNSGRVKAANSDSGVVVLDQDGWAAVPFVRGYLDGHYCNVADGWDEVTIGFSAKGFTVSAGMPGQEINWACVPN